MPISLEAILLVVELLLLAFTLFVVVQSRREEKARGKLIDEMYRTAGVLSRQEYFIAVMDALLRAKTDVFGCVTGSSPRADHDLTMDRILEQIKVESSKGVNVRYLIPRSPDRIELGSLYTRAGAEVRYHRGALRLPDGYQVKGFFLRHQVRNSFHLRVIKSPDPHSAEFKCDCLQANILAHMADLDMHIADSPFSVPRRGSFINRRKQEHSRRVSNRSLTKSSPAKLRSFVPLDGSD